MSVERKVMDSGWWMVDDRFDEAKFMAADIQSRNHEASDHELVSQTR